MFTRRTSSAVSLICSRAIIRYTSKTTKINKLNTLLIKMPKDYKHVMEAQKQRIKIKEKNNKYVPGTVNLQVLGSGTPGTPACVYLFTDQQRYLFNCGEGTQRLSHEHRAKLARLEHIFMTRNSWQKTGGLPGLCLTLQDAGVPSLTLHGPPRLGEIFKAMRRFVILRDLKVDDVECTLQKNYDDQVMTVYYVPITKDIDNSSEVEMEDVTQNRLSPPPLEDCTDYYSHESIPGSLTAQSSGISSPSNLDIPLPPSEEDTVMAYICKLKARPGQLNLEKCVEKGVPPGPLLGQLKNGNDITLANGVVVKANEVRAKNDPGPVFIVLDIPSEDYMTALTENWNQFAKFAEDDAENMSLVIHFTPTHVMQTTKYKEFISRFPSHTTHLAVNNENKFSGYVAAHRIQVQLNQLNEHIFPLLKEPVETNNDCAPNSKKFKSSRSPSPSTSPSVTVNGDERKLSIESVAPMTCFHLRPHHGLDRSIEQKLAYDEYIEESVNIPDFGQSLTNLRAEIAEIYTNVNRQTEYPKIVYLGTGSCIPNKTRNVSAILVQPTPNSNILLDCGEGTAGQIIRMYGETEARKIFRDLNLIYVSHLHADHHIGLIGLLQQRREILGETTPENRVLLLAPKQFFSWLYFYDRRIEKLQRDYKLIGNAELLDVPLKSDRLFALGIDSIETCMVRHCPHSFGVSLKLVQTEPNSKSPIKITYSGDTMPCNELVELGRDSTMLIHEATMEDELVVEARIKMHSTISQAIEQGRRMNSKYTMLTHFSQRYAKLPRIDDNVDTNVSIAFDNMEVTLMDLPNFRQIYPTLKLLFVEQCEEMEAKAQRRAFRKQREQEQLPDTKNVAKVLVT